MRGTNSCSSGGDLFANCGILIFVFVFLIFFGNNWGCGMNKNTSGFRFLFI
ncbi:MAG: hypothetical protein Q8920_06225 [Bacillota bacterium]|nr:hypothetical protein [Bacillota bacterium]